MTILKPRLLRQLDSRTGTSAFFEKVGPTELPEIWLAQRTDCDEEARACDALLTDEEKIRRDRFRRTADQQRFALGRGWLRVLLGEYLGLPPRQVDLRYGPHGKPYVKLREQSSGVYFNIAHSGDVVLFAIHPNSEVGIDVEQEKDTTHWDRVASQLFSPQEFANWSTFDEKQRRHSFYAEWTRREAGLKAMGSGFAIEQPIGWDTPLRFFDLELPLDYAGSVAIARSD